VNWSKHGSKLAMIDRRQVLAGLTATTAGAAVLAGQGGFSAAKAEADTVPVEELMKSDGLDELAMGPADAKVVVVEYASMSCGHCARFHEDVFPELKKKYIDTDKVRFVFREFPLDNRAAAASMLARCVGGDKTFPMISVLFETQEDWAYVRSSPLPKLFEIAKQAGFTQEKFNACLKDDALLKKLTERRQRASTVFGVNSTPTFFVNGQRMKGATSLEAFSEVIDPILAKS